METKKPNRNIWKPQAHGFSISAADWISSKVDAFLFFK